MEATNHMDLKQTLEDAIGTGELLTISYAGGSQPGTTRMISPIKIEGDKVRARCYTSNRVKVFTIRKITIFENNTKGETTYKEGQHTPEPATLAEAIEPRIQELSEMGWHVELSEDEVGVHRFFKNGKMRKTPDVYLIYQEYTSDYFDQDSYGELVEHKKRSSRPWYVKSNASGENASSFSVLSHAASRFFEFSHAAAEKYNLKKS